MTLPRDVHLFRHSSSTATHSHSGRLACRKGYCGSRSLTHLDVGVFRHLPLCSVRYGVVFFEWWYNRGGCLDGKLRIRDGVLRSRRIKVWRNLSCCGGCHR